MKTIGYLDYTRAVKYIEKNYNNVPNVGDTEIINLIHKFRDDTINDYELGRLKRWMKIKSVDK